MAKNISSTSELDTFSMHVRAAYSSGAQAVCLTCRPKSVSLLVLDGAGRIIEPLAVAPMADLQALIDEALTHFGPGRFQLSSSSVLPTPTASPSLQLPW